jgi:hypothetical protein
VLLWKAGQPTAWAPWGPSSTCQGGEEEEEEEEGTKRRAERPHLACMHECMCVCVCVCDCEHALRGSAQRMAR